MDDEPDDSLPETVKLHDQAFAPRVFLMMEAFNWRFLPSQILAEDAMLMEDLLQMRGLKFTIDRALHPPKKQV